MNLHPAIAPLVADPRMTVRVPPPHVPMDRVRAAANRAMAIGPTPDLFSVEDVVLAQADVRVPARLYRPVDHGGDEAIVFCHGGGFVWGSLDTHDGLCRRMARTTGKVVVSIDYRLSPEEPYPAAETDVVCAVRAVLAGAVAGLERGCRVSLSGDSAGGYLARHAAIALAGETTKLARLVLVYPALDPECRAPSHRRNAEGPVLTSEAMKWFWSAHGIGRNPRTPADRPLDGGLRVFVLAAELDPLHDEAQAFAADLAGSGIDVDFTTAAGMVHGFLSLEIPPDLREHWEALIFQALID